MTSDEVIALAREAGFVLADNATDEAVGRFADFAAMITEKERDACVQVCIKQAARWPYPSQGNAVATVIATEILARGYA